MCLRSERANKFARTFARFERCEELSRAKTELNTALVTGATGLLGSHLVEALLESGVRVRILVRPSSDICPAIARLVPGSAELVAGGLDYLSRDSFLDMMLARVELGFSPRFIWFEGVELTWNYFNG